MFSGLPELVIGIGEDFIMKTKILSVAAAAMLAVVFLSGCSNAFSKKTFTGTAEKYGMKKVGSYSEYVGIRMNQDLESKYFYYVMDNPEEADWYYSAQYTVGSGPFPEIHVKECVLASEYKIVELDGSPLYRNADIYMITAVDRQSAIDLYEAFAKFCKEENFASGEENGYTYSIRYMEGKGRERLVGAYLKDETVIYMDGFCEAKEKGGCVNFFCKELGLVSPLTLKK